VAARRAAKRALNDTEAARKITKRIQELAGWRGETLARVRRLIHDADPDIEEEWKWEKASSPGVPVWSHAGIVCTGEAYTQVVKLTFARGASLADPKKLFNASLGGNLRRAIDIHEGEKINETAFKALVRSAAALNSAKVARKPAGSSRKPVLLSGGNPQIAKASGDPAVQAYIAAMPGWKREVGRRLDSLIVRTVPGVDKAVKWNSPFYGVTGQGWFLSFHTFTNYVKVTFFCGASLRPLPPGQSKHKDVRHLDLHKTSLTRHSWRHGSGKRPRCPAGPRRGRARSSNSGRFRA
jgi:hypothetical protein